MDDHVARFEVMKSVLSCALYDFRFNNWLRFFNSHFFLFFFACNRSVFVLLHQDNV